MAKTSDCLITKRDGGIFYLTLNRPEKLNALNKELFEDLKRFVDLVETDKTVRVLIITGTGDKAFCVGADLKERQGMNEKDILVRMDFVHRLYQRIENLSFPVITAINGLALGGGMELALVSDFRLAEEHVTVGFPEVDLAIIPGNGGTQRIQKLVGTAKALELVLFARRITAAEALQLGILHKVVKTGQVMAEATQWAKELLEAGPIALKQAKRAVRGAAERTMPEGLNYELECYKQCLYSKDRLEGLKAFAEKRKPNYLGE